MAGTASDDRREGDGTGPYRRLHLAALGLATLVAYLVTSPPIYGYGVGNQTSQLPLIKHAMDPTYLANDWVVGARTGFAAPKFYYNQFVAAVAEVIGLPNAVFVVYVAAVVVVFVGVWFFVEELVDDELAATVAVGFLLAHHVTVPDSLPYPPNLGGNSLVQHVLQPSVLANAFVLVGLAYVIRSRYRRGYVAFGVATLFHVTNGFWMALTAGLCIVAVEARADLRAGRVEAAVRSIPWGAAAIYGLVSSIVIVPLLLANPPAGTGFEAAYVMAWVRHPHHYVLSTWPVLPTVLTILFMLTLMGLLYRFRALIFPDADRSSFAFAYVLSISAILLFGGFVFTEVIPVETVVKLTPYRTEDFLYIVLYAGAAKLLVVALHRAGARTDADAATVATVVLVAVVLVGTVGWGASVALVESGRTPIDANLGLSDDRSLSENVQTVYVDTPSTPARLEATYEWIGAETPEDAVFLASPSQNRFRLSTSRARVVNTKSFPFRTEAMLEWNRRMNAVCNADIRSFQDEQTTFGAACDDRFTDMSQAEIRTVADSYGAGWLLTKNPNYDFPREYSNGEYYVYRIPDTAGAS